MIGGGFRNVLVIGADALSQYVDWTDRGTCILFGDAAGAVLLQVHSLFSSVLGPNNSLFIAEIWRIQHDWVNNL